MLRPHTARAMRLARDQVRLLPPKGLSTVGFDAKDLSRRRDPATRRSDAYRGGTLTHKRSAASRSVPNVSGLVYVTTHHYYAQGGGVRLTESGCQGARDHGPNAIAYYCAPDGRGLAEAWYAGIGTVSLVAIARALHRGDAPPPEGRYDPGGRIAEPVRRT